MKKKYARLKGSLGFSNATAPAASNGPATKKANRSTKTNKPAISKIGRMSTAFLSRSSFQKNNNNLFINIPILIYLKSPDISCRKPFQTPKKIQRLTQPFLSSQFPFVPFPTVNNIDSKGKIRKTERFLRNPVFGKVWNEFFVIKIKYLRFRICAEG